MDQLNIGTAMTASAASHGGDADKLAPKGRYVARCFDKDGNLKWEDHFDNLVTTVGKNDMMDKYLAGTTYTAAFYMGLISSTGYGVGPAAGDTAASHAGWAEAGTTAAPTYSNGTRPAAVWSAAAGGVKALNAPLTFTMSGAGTIKGSFLSTSPAKDSASGIIFSAGTFQGGDKVVAGTDTIQVSYQLSM